MTETATSTPTEPTVRGTVLDTPFGLIQLRVGGVDLCHVGADRLTINRIPYKVGSSELRPPPADHEDRRWRVRLSMRCLDKGWNREPTWNAYDKARTAIEEAANAYLAEHPEFAAQGPRVAWEQWRRQAEGEVEHARRTLARAEAALREVEADEPE